MIVKKLSMYVTTVLLAVGVVLAGGCGRSSGTGETADTKESSYRTETADKKASENTKEFDDEKSASDSEDAIKLVWYTCEEGPVKDLENVMESANEYSKDKIGVVVDINYVDSKKLDELADTEEYYDMIFTSEWMNRFDAKAASGKYYDITELVKNETPELYDEIGTYWDAATVKGRLYGVPTLKDMGSEMMFRFNADYFEKEKGMDIPDRMEFADVEKYLEVYKADYPDSYPLAMTETGPGGLTNFLERVIGNIIVIPYEGEIRAVPFWENEKLMERYRLLHKWYQAGYIDPDAVNLKDEDVKKDVPVRFGVAWKGYLGFSNPADWGFNVALSFFDGPYISRRTEQGAMTAINAQCDEEHAKAALRYIELLNTDSHFRDIIAYGIEGVHFRYMDNGTVLQLKDGLDRYNPGLYNTGSVVNASLVSASEDFPADPKLWDRVFAGYKSEGIYSKTEGFVYDQSTTQDVVDKINKIYDEYAAVLRTGTGDPDELVPKIKKKMEKAGITGLVDDINNQLKEHLQSVK